MRSHCSINMVTHFHDPFSVNAKFFLQIKLSFYRLFCTALSLSNKTSRVNPRAPLPQATHFFRTYHSLMDATLTYIYHLLFTAALPQFILTMEQTFRVGRELLDFPHFFYSKKRIKIRMLVKFGLIYWMKAKRFYLPLLSISPNHHYDESIDNKKTNN